MSKKIGIWRNFSKIGLGSPRSAFRWIIFFDSDQDPGGDGALGRRRMEDPIAVAAGPISYVRMAHSSDDTPGAIELGCLVVRHLIVAGPRKGVTETADGIGPRAVVQSPSSNASLGAGTTHTKTTVDVGSAGHNERQWQSAHSLFSRSRNPTEHIARREHTIEAHADVTPNDASRYTGTSRAHLRSRQLTLSDNSKKMPLCGAQHLGNKTILSP